MLTREEICSVVIARSIEDNIYTSSTLAVAKEYLGLLNDEEKKYSIQRSGILFSNNEGKCLTLRELLDLLPE